MARNQVAPDVCTMIHEDALAILRQLSGARVGGRGRRYRRVERQMFDVVVLDPPGWATGPFGAVDLVRDYSGVFKPALLATRPGGRLLVTHNVAKVSLEDWLDALHRCGLKAGRPLQHVEVLTPEDDFPSPDGRTPLKMAWITV